MVTIRYYGVCWRSWGKLFHLFPDIMRIFLVLTLRTSISVGIGWRAVLCLSGASTKEIAPTHLTLEKSIEVTVVTAAIKQNIVCHQQACSPAQHTQRTGTGLVQAVIEYYTGTGAGYPYPGGPSSDRHLFLTDRIFKSIHNRNLFKILIKKPSSYEKLYTT